MSDRDRKSAWIWIGCFVALSIPLVFLVDRLAEKEPGIVLWSDLRYGDPKNRAESIHSVSITERALRGSIISGIDFRDEPFFDCVETLENALNDRSAGPRVFRIVLDDSVSGVDIPVRLHLNDVPVAEGLRYLTALVGLKYRVMNDGSVLMVPLDDADELEEGWFDPGPAFFGDVDPFSEKVDVRETLKSAGIVFSEGTVADYYPQKELMWVRNTRDQLELVDAYIDSVIYCHPELTWRDQIHHYWLLLTDGYPSPSISVRPVPDPFGGVATGASEPDPFGGGVSSGKAEPDPFK